MEPSRKKCIQSLGRKNEKRKKIHCGQKRFGKINGYVKQRWSRGHKARGQGQGHKKKSEAKDSFSEDRHSRGQGQECSRPKPRTKDTSASALKKKKEKVFAKIFQAISKKKKGLHKNFSGDLHKKTFFKKLFKRSTKF